MNQKAKTFYLVLIVTLLVSGFSSCGVSYLKDYSGGKDQELNAIFDFLASALFWVSVISGVGVGIFIFLWPISGSSNGYRLENPRVTEKQTLAGATKQEEEIRVDPF